MSLPTREVWCPGCRAQVTVKELELGLGIASCPSCRAPLPSHRPAPPEPPRPPPPAPQNIEVRQGGGVLILVTPWFGPRALLVLLGWVFFAGYSLDRLSTISVPSALWTLVVTLGFGYYTLALLINRTILCVERGSTLSVRHRPLPWFGQIELRANQIAQVYLQKMDQGWNVIVLGRNGQRRLVMGGLDDKYDARALEHQLEAFLGLQDRAVRGEDASP
jgi:hypothetical protein